MGDENRDALDEETEEVEEEEEYEEEEEKEDKGAEGVEREAVAEAAGVWGGRKDVCRSQSLMEPSDEQDSSRSRPCGHHFTSSTEPPCAPATVHTRKPPAEKDGEEEAAEGEEQDSGIRK